MLKATQLTFNPNFVNEMCILRSTSTFVEHSSCRTDVIHVTFPHPYVLYRTYQISSVEITGQVSDAFLLNILRKGPIPLLWLYTIILIDHPFIPLPFHVSPFCVYAYAELDINCFSNFPPLSIQDIVCV